MAAYSGYSAKVALSLLVGGIELALSHLGPKGFIVRDECDPIPACSARLIVKIDSTVRESEVFLPHGVAGAGARVAYL